MARTMAFLLFQYLLLSTITQINVNSIARYFWQFDIIQHPHFIRNPHFHYEFYIFIIKMVLSMMMDMLNVKFMLVFLACYALYGILLTLTAYFSRIYTIDQRLSFRELILAIIACFFETTFLRFYLEFVRVTAFVGYKKNKLNWDKLERKKMNRI